MAESNNGETCERNSRQAWAGVQSVGATRARLPQTTRKSTRIFNGKIQVGKTKSYTFFITLQVKF